jgi:hypothetical protein
MSQLELVFHLIKLQKLPMRLMEKKQKVIMQKTKQKIILPGKLALAL